MPSNAFADTEAQKQLCGLKTVVEISALGTSVNISNTSRGQRESEREGDHFHVVSDSAW